MKYLTKSRFKMALECPTKLYYASNKEYQNLSLDDPFLKALAEGGFQVGELAKAYYPDGHDIKTLDKVEAVSQTNELLKQDNVVIFEAAIMTDDFFIRVDVLKKTSNSIHLIEVKAKSIDPNLDDQFWNKTQLKKGFNKLSTSWKPYLYDIAFQKAVTAIAFPKANITCSLMLADKSSVATVDGLNQMFAIKKDDNGRTYAERTYNADVGEKVLTCVNVDYEVEHIISGTDHGQYSRDELGIPSFHDDMKEWAKLYKQNIRQEPHIGSHCKTCEFKSKDHSFKSGFHECWKIKENEKTVLDMWNFRQSAHLINDGIKLLSEMNEADIKPSKSKNDGLSISERQTIQLEKYKAKDTRPYVNYTELNSEMNSWEYPLNFIDFETSMVALPFNKGRRPYEQIAFQFSHHILHKDGTIEHAAEYINQKVGHFPNFDFVRELKKALEKNSGTIFKYSNHENTVLNQIIEQLENSNEADQKELIDWIKTITHKKNKKREYIRQGERDMVDLLELVKKYYYHPNTNGSNSIKAVLPAILFESALLKDKYSKPIYGTNIKSLNFKEWTWLKKDENGNVIDPYKQLEPLEKSEVETALFANEVIKDGGAAATGYAAMQFMEMSKSERESITKGLLRYCELDTFAMVLIVEHWQELMEIEKIKKAI